jgi:hypothetical protein
MHGATTTKILKEIWQGFITRKMCPI